MKLIFSYILILITFSTQAQVIKSFIDKSTIGQNEVCTISYSFESKPSAISFPDFSPFRIIDQSQETVTEVYNGKVTYRVVYNISLLATQIGTFTIPKLEAVIARKNEFSKAFKITVTQQASKKEGKSKSNNQFDPFSFLEDDRFGIFERKKRKQSISGTWEDNVKLRISTSKESVYVGEKIRINLDLILHPEIGVDDYSLLSGFKTQGFTSGTFQSRKQLQRESYKLDGEPFSKVNLGYVDAYPQISGEVTIDPAKLKLVAVIEQFNRKRLQLSSNSIKLNIKALPPNKPENYTGYVGNLSASRSLNSTQLEVDNGSALIYTFEGEGNIEGISIDPPNLGPDFEFFSPESNISNGKRIVRFPFVARSNGSYQIPAHSISYLNTKTGEYTDIMFDTIQVQVNGQSTSGTAYSLNSNGNDTTKDTDIRFIHVNASVKQPSTSIPIHIVVIISVVLCCFGFLIPSLNRKSKAAIEKKRTPYKIALQEIQAKKDPVSILMQYAVGTTRIPLSKLTTREWLAYLESKNQVQLSKRHSDWIQQAQYASYADSSGQAQSLFKNLETLLHDTEKAL